MWIDLTLLALVLAGVLHGWTRGMAAQLLGVAGVAAVWWASPQLVPPLRDWLLAHGQQPSLGLELACLAAAVVVVGGGAAILTATIPTSIQRSGGVIGGADRIGGACLGAARSGTLLWLLVALVAWAEPTLARQWPVARAPLRDSHAVAAARQWNPWKLIDPSHLDALRVQLVRGWTAGDGVAPLRLRAVLDDASLRSAAERGDRATLLADRRVRELLADPGFRAWLATRADATQPEAGRAVPSSDAAGATDNAPRGPLAPSTKPPAPSRSRPPAAP